MDLSKTMRLAESSMLIKYGSKRLSMAGYAIEKPSELGEGRGDGGRVPEQGKTRPLSSELLPA